MHHLLGAAAVACAALSASADARMLRWEANPNDAHWLPPRETMAVQALLGGDGVSPMPTAPPLLPPRELLDKRSGTNNTCAFVSGSADIPLYCATNSGCVFHSERKAFGCCPDRTVRSTQFCEAWTTCLHSSEGTRVDPSNMDGLTMWCGNSRYPSCVKHTFADSSLLGYSLWGCGKIATTDLVLRSATDASSTSGSGGGGSGTTRPGGTPRPTIPLGPDGPQSATPGPGGPSSGQTQDSQGGPPLGAIIGGAVGGFAALAILGFAIFFLVRRSRRTGAAHPVHNQQNGVPSGAGDPASPGGPGGGPAPVPGSPGSPGSPGGHPQQQGYPPQMAEQQGQQGQYGFAPVAGVVDPRHSMAKPPYSVTNSVYDPAGMSPPHSPSPGYHNGVNPTPSPPPPSQSPVGQAPQPFGAAWAMPQPQQQPPQQQFNAMPPPGGFQPPQQFQQPHQGYAELPTGRGDRELRELA